MYKNLVWFGLGYVACKHVVPVLKDAIVKTSARLKEERASD